MILFFPNLLLILHMQKGGYVKGKELKRLSLGLLMHPFG